MTMLRLAAAVALLACEACALKKVLVTGAGGRTGKLVFEKLKKDYDTITPVGLARSAKAVKALKKAGASADEVVTADIADEAALASAMANCDAVVMCTSAVPAIKKWSLVKLLFKKTILRRKDAGRPEFKFGPGCTPEEVDWLGAKKQIDAAKAAGVSHFVFVSSMGGTQPENFLNTIGKQDDGSGGDILLWKRKAERYLVDSGVPFTIVHPGGLVDEEPGKRELTVEVDDVLLGLKSRSVARADVARVCCAALFDDAALGKSFDLASKPVGEGTPTLHAASVFEALAGKTCDYATVLDDPPSIPALRG